jgi:O-acetyl-ADP-ribose deacetylase (regulator of RNase III)
MIRIVEGDITSLGVQAVIRPADDQLEAQGRTAARLDEAGGTALVHLRRTQAPLEVGSAVITGAGDLPVEFVLHLVIHGEERAASRDTIRRALASAWHRAEAWELSSIAVSLEDLGGMLLSIDEAARLLVESFLGRKRPDDAIELQVVVRSPNERDAIAPWIPTS